MNLTASIVALASVVAAGALSAQNTQPERFMSLVSVNIRPEGLAHFEAFVRQIGEAALKIGLKQRVDAYQMAQGESAYTFHFISHFEHLGAFDRAPSVGGILTQAHGEAEGRQILRAGHAHVASAATLVLRVQPEFSIRLRPMTGTPYFQLVRTEIDPAMVSQYELYLTKARAAGEKHAEMPVTMRYSTTFGQSNVYFAALPFASYGERERWPSPSSVLTAAYGKSEAEALLNSARASTERQDNWIVALRRDLSRPVMP